MTEEQERVTEEQGKGIYITPRSMLIALAVVLAVVLIALLIYLLLTSRKGLTVPVSDQTIAGIRAELVVLGPGRGETPKFSGPMGAAWDPQGSTFYVADSENNRICVFSATGTFVREFGGFGIAKPLPGAQATWEQGELNYPTDVAVDDEGNVYVADFYNDSISVFTSRGEFVRRFPDPNTPTGKGGSGQDGKGIAVTALTVSGNRVYATDSYQVFVFSLQGELLEQFGKPGGAPGDLDRPNGIVVDDQGRVIVSDSNNNRIQVFSPRGEPLDVSTLGQQEDGSRVEALILPRGVTLLQPDSILVADPLAHRLTRITHEWVVEDHYGERGVEPGQLNFPNDVDSHENRILVADRENSRVQVVRLVDE